MHPAFTMQYLGHLLTQLSRAKFSAFSVTCGRTSLRRSIRFCFSRSVLVRDSRFGSSQPFFQTCFLRRKIRRFSRTGIPRPRGAPKWARNQSVPSRYCHPKSFNINHIKIVVIEPRYAQNHTPAPYGLSVPPAQYGSWQRHQASRRTPSARCGKR